MAEAVAGAIRGQRHLVVQAGTGTGKSLAYLVPALVLGTRAVVSTATKALQDQLAIRDLPHLATALDMPVRVRGLEGAVQLHLPAADRRGRQAVTSNSCSMTRMTPRGHLAIRGRSVGRFGGWSIGPVAQATGDRAELAWEPSRAAWAQVSVGARDCPGRPGARQVGSASQRQLATEPAGLTW